MYAHQFIARKSIKEVHTHFFYLIGSTVMDNKMIIGELGCLENFQNSVSRSRVDLELAHITKNKGLVIKKGHNSFFLSITME